MPNKSLATRIRHFILALGTVLALVYVGLPLLTNSVDILQRMSVQLDKNGIDPSRYYYTDIEQVNESVQHIRQVFEDLRQ